MILCFPDFRTAVPKKVAGHLGAMFSPVYLTRTASPAFKINAHTCVMLLQMWKSFGECVLKQTF